MVPAGDEKAVSDATVRNMKEKYDNFMHTGIFGLGHIGQALSRYGNSQAAWDMFTKTGENSFAYMWTDADATTLDPQGIYPNIEVYFHFLVREISAAQTVGGNYTALE